MMTTEAAIKRALVVKLRANATLKAQVPGGFHEGFAPEKKPYPIVVYTIAWSPYVYTWDSLMLICGFDVSVWSPSSVDANNVDALIFTTLHDASLVVDGQTTLICRRVAGLSSQDVDEEGKKVYMVGGTYEVWTDQPL